MLKIFISLCVIFTSCSTAKNTVKADYSKEQDLRDSVSMLTIENNKLTNENLQLQYASISFDTIRLSDTVDRVNTVVITKEGEIKSKGNIRKVVVSNAFYTKIIDEKSKTIDSLRLVKNKVSERLIYKDREVKKSFIPFWLWLVIIGLVAFNFRKQIVKLWNTFH
jgi:hypothetical protein